MQTKGSDLNFFAKFRIDFSKEMPFFYGLFTIMFAIILGVGTALIRKFISNFREKLYSIPKGDSNLVSIAAASIVAKYTRDNYMKRLSNEFVKYNWDKNKGYGTKEHLLAIKKYGICNYHRKHTKNVFI